MTITSFYKILLSVDDFFYKNKRESSSRLRCHHHNQKTTWFCLSSQWGVWWRTQPATGSVSQWHCMIHGTLPNNVSRAQFHRAAQHENLLSIDISSLIKIGLPTKFQIVAYCLLLIDIQLLFAHPETHVEIWLVILFLSKQAEIKC